MAALQGTILASKIVPTDSLDTYATHEDKYGRGGHRSVDTIVERDEISPERRKEGMTVYVKENKTKYILEGGIDNANWKVDSSGGGSGGGNVDLSEYYKKTETYSKVEVDTKIADIPPTDLSGYYNKTETETLLSNKVTKNEAIIGATKTKITYDSNGLVINGADLSTSDIPNLPQSKIINLETNLSSKVDKGVGVVGATKTKITYNNDGIITGGADLAEADLPNISQSKITNLETDLSNKQSKLVSGTNIKTINGQSVLGSGDIVITGEVDLSNYYTKPQVNEFINEINTKLDLPPVTLGEYGVRWNQETDVYEELGATNRTQIQRNMKRCVLNNDGTVNYYLNPTNSTLKENGTPAVLTGADGNVMVEVPKFWYKHTLVGNTHEWRVSNGPLEGYSVHPWFLEGGVERPFRYYRAYTPTVVAGKLRSISGSTPTRSQTRNTFRTQARANGTGWGLCSWNAVNAIQILFLTEYCTFNTQAVLGRGNDTGGDFGITTGQSNSIGNASSGATNNDMWMSYRGIENWYVDCWEFIDGLNIQNYKVFLNQNPATFADDVFTGDYVDSGVTLPAMSASYIKKITGNFLPTAVGGSSSTFVTDGWWSDSTGTLAIFGGGGLGLLGGGFSFYASLSAGNFYDNTSAGLSR